MSVLAFPSHAHSAPSPDAGPAQVIPFTGSPKGLTPADVCTLRQLMKALGRHWFWELRRDPDGALWGLIGSRRGHDVSDAFLVYRRTPGVVFFVLGPEDQQALGIR